MIIKRTKIVDNGSFASARTNTLIEQIMNTNIKTESEMKNKNKLSEENSHACF